MKLLKGRSWKRVAITAVSLAVIAMVSAYLYATRPARLRAALVAALDQFDSLELADASLSFSLLNGLQIRDLRVVLKEDSPVFEASSEPAAREVLRVAAAQVRLHRGALLVGRAVPVEIRVEGAAVHVVRDSASGRLNWTLRPKDDPADSFQMTLPRIVVTDADVQFWTVRDGRRRLLKRIRVDVRGEQAGDEFVVQVVAADEPHDPLGGLRWNPETGQIVADLGWTRLETVLGLLPPVYSRLEEKLHMAGKARLIGGMIKDGAVVGATIEFEQVRAALPLGDAGWELPPQQRFLHIADAVGKMRISDEQATATVVATVNGAAVEMRIEATLDREHPPHSAFEVDVKVERLAVPSINDEKHAAFFEDLPSGLTAFFRNYQPEVLVSANMTITRQAGEGRALAADGWVDFHEGDCRYFRFPYQFHEASGRVRFGPGGITLENIQAKHGSTRVTVNGKLAHSRKWTAFDLDIRAANVPLDADLYAAIPERFRRTWDDVRPIGLSDVRVGIHRDEGSPGEEPLQTKVRIDALFNSVSLSLDQDRRLTHADGQISIADGVTTIHELHGFLDGAEVRLAGSVRAGAEGRRGAASFSFTAVGVPINYPTGDDEGNPAFRIDAHGDVWGRISRNGNREDDDDRYVVQLRDGSITAGDATTPWTIDEGWISRQGGELEIVELSARQGSAWLKVSGVVPARDDGARPPRLDIRAGNLRMETLWQQAPPGHWKDVCEQLGFAGEGRLSIKLGAEEVLGGDGRQTAEIHIESDRLKPSSLPIDLEHASAHLVVYPDHCELIRASARYGAAGKIRATGRLGWEGARRWSEFAVDAVGIEFDKNLASAMPGKLRTFFERMNLMGKIDLHLDQLSYDSAGGGSWGFGGRMGVTGATLNVGLLLADCRGEISGHGRFGPNDRLEFDAAFTVVSGRLAGRPIEHFSGTITRGAGDEILRLDKLQGNLAGGLVSGSAEINPATSAYELKLTIHDVSFDEFLRGNGNEAGAPRDGRLDGHFFVGGKMDMPGDRIGGGKLRIRGASLLGTPIIRKIIQKRRDDGQPISSALDLAELDFRLVGDIVHIDKADIQSR
ncbi:MAG: hypothetical protein IID33_05630, partial [Planctomycetes bacterium]|nr:hypothetical protein [Planctomycetota bacterium]